jgi:hypothetical protein
MAEGVQGAACVICFMTQAYQDSANCNLELKFAQQSGVPIVPVMMQPNFTATKWLAILTAGHIWTPMYDIVSVSDGVTKLIAQAQHLIPGMLKDADRDATSDLASETSDNTASFDVAGWGDEMFSLTERREELERLRVETAPTKKRSGNGGSSSGDGSESLLCSLPAMVPTLPRGLFVTTEMQSVLNAVLSETSTPQIGFCGMGGIGKTTVSSWVANNDAVRTRFGMIAWISLGQTPVLDACFNLLYLQLTGTAMADGLPSDQKHEHLKQAFLNRSVLLVLDDCWDAEVATHFKWIDPNTNSKILISSRVRNVLAGGDIIDVTVPTKAVAVKMLLSTAGMDIEALQSREEVAQIAELCKRLPLTIGIAGKLIKEMTNGSSTIDASDWSDVVELLKAEVNDPTGDLSLEESVIRASIKSIPKKMRKQVTQLFHAFALVPEDTHVPLPVLGMCFDVCSMEVDSSKTSTLGIVKGTCSLCNKNVHDTQARWKDPHSGNYQHEACKGGGETSKPATPVPLSRMHVRRYLKVLIDRSLVLGTVDRPQLHDVMLEFVKKELTGERYKAAQRRLVDAFRKADRTATSATGKYMQVYIKYHITESYDEVWGKSQQAMSWLEDHVNGEQDIVAISTASILPDVKALAIEAEDAKLWWRAALRWSVFALVKMGEGGTISAGYEFLSRGVEGAANIAIDTGDCTQFELDSFNLIAMSKILMSWRPEALATYGERIEKLAAAEAGKSRPVLLVRIYHATVYFPALVSGNVDRYSAASWEVSKRLMDLSDESTDVYSRLTEEERYLVKPSPLLFLLMGGDALIHTPGFTFDAYGPHGDKLLEWTNAYNYQRHHTYLAAMASVDSLVAMNGADWLLTLQYGRVSDAMPILNERLRLMERLVTDTSSPSRAFDLGAGLSNLLVLFHIHGQSHLIRKLISVLGFTFDSASDYLSVLTEHHHGWASMDQKGLCSLTRLLWQVKSFLVMHTDVPAAKVSAWLQSLPDDEGFYEISVTMPTFDFGAFWGPNHQTCWLALVHEKVGLYDGALRFCRLALEPDLLKAGMPGQNIWSLTIASACQGRVLTKLNRHMEALAAFQAAITTSKESFSMMEAFAYRELAKCNAIADAAIAEAAAQAERDLEEKLKEFEGRMTRAEFDMLTIAPPLTPALE